MYVDRDTNNLHVFMRMEKLPQAYMQIGWMEDDFRNLKVLWNANACWFVLIYNTLTITNVAKRLFKYVPYILLSFFC